MADRRFEGDDFAASASAALSEGLRQTLAYREFVTISIVSADGQEIIAEENAGTPVRLRPPPDAFEEASKGEVVTTLYEPQGMWHRANQDFGAGRWVCLCRETF
jgi:two-component system nitrogen regulation sensor histidine kinase NtrY